MYKTAFNFFLTTHTHFCNNSLFLYLYNDKEMHSYYEIGITGYAERKSQCSEDIFVNYTKVYSNNFNIFLRVNIFCMLYSLSFNCFVIEIHCSLLQMFN